MISLLLRLLTDYKHGRAIVFFFFLLTGKFSTLKWALLLLRSLLESDGHKAPIKTSWSSIDISFQERLMFFGK